MKSLSVTDQEAEQINRQNSGIWLRLLRKQPPEGQVIREIAMTKPAIVYGYFWNENATDNDMGSFEGEVKLRYPSGRYAVKETWRMRACVGDFYFVEYKSDGVIYKYSALDLSSPFHNVKYSPNRWRSPPTMPRKAIRWKDLEVETSVKRIGELSPEDMVLSGIDKHWCKKFAMPNVDEILDDFIHHWNITLGHAKPVRDGDRYVSYPYSIGSFLTLYTGNKNLKLGQQPIANVTWKGKPLIIYVDPYLEVISWKKEICDAK